MPCDWLNRFIDFSAVPTNAPIKFTSTAHRQQFVLSFPAPQWIARSSRFRIARRRFRARRKRRYRKRAADGRAMGRGWLRSIRALRLLLTQPLSHVTLLNPYYFNLKRSLSKPTDFWDRHWHPMDWSEHTPPKPSLCVRCTRPSANLGCQSTELAEGWIQKTQSASHITCSRTRSASAQPFRVHGWASFHVRRCIQGSRF